MIINIKTTPTFIVTPGVRDEKSLRREQAMAKALRSFEDVTHVAGAYLPRDPVLGCSLSHAITAKCAVNLHPPLLILEDDSLPETEEHFLNVPNDADAVYLGISTGGTALNATQNIHHWGGNFYSDTEYPGLVRIYNMLSTHALLILSKEFLINYMLCAIESAAVKAPIDCFLAKTQQHYNVFAQRKPWFYQAQELEGQEQYTRAEFDGIQIEGPEDLPRQFASYNQPCISADLAAWDKNGTL